jgi:hypothetical protein
VWDGVVIDGIVGTFQGVVALTPWGENPGEAWTSLAQLATGLSVLGVPGTGDAVQYLLPDGPVKDWFEDSQQTTQDAAKGMVAWDTWDEDPSRAAGATTFNILTTIATGGAGTAAASSSAAARAASAAARAAANAGHVLDPLTWPGHAVAALPRFTDLINDLSPTPATPLPDGGFRLPDTNTTLPPNPSLADLPPGVDALRLPGGDIYIPGQHADVLPGIPDPDRPGVYLTPDGHLVNPHGHPTPDGNPPRHEHTPNPDRDLAPVGAHTNPGEAAAHTTDDLVGGMAPDGPTNHLGDSAPGGGSGSGSHLPGDHAGSSGEPSSHAHGSPTGGEIHGAPGNGGVTGGEGPESPPMSDSTPEEPGPNREEGSGSPPPVNQGEDGISNRERPPREGDTNYVVDDPNDWSDTITDIDRVEDGVLWEEKTATGQDPRINAQKWTEKHVLKKLDSYLRARQHLPGFNDAPIGIHFTEPGATPAFRAAVESAVKSWRSRNPGVEVIIRWAS